MKIVCHLKTTGLLLALLSLCCASKAQTIKWVVAQNGSGNFTTIQAAFNAVPTGNSQPIMIYVKAGIYKEKLHIDAGKNHVSLIGQGAANTILTFNDHTGKVSPHGDTINTRTSHSVYIAADDFYAQGIGFENNSGFNAGQAVAAEVQGNRCVFYQCSFTGFQDVLFLNNDNSLQYYRDCYIEGTTDFIFGSATAWFEHCTIRSKKNSHITAASTPQNHNYGFVFNQCTLLADSGLNRVSLGRPWRPYACVAYLRCTIGAHIMPEGWSNWNKTDNYLTTRFAEYQNNGPGAQTAARVTWAKQLSTAQAAQITVTNVLNNWNPQEIISTFTHN